MDPAAYWVGDDGRIRLTGLILARDHGNGHGDRTTAFTLPDGVRPAADCDFEITAASGPSTATVKATGEVMVDPTEQWVRLDGIAFESA